MTSHLSPESVAQMVADREAAYQSYLNEITTNGNSRLDNIILSLSGNEVQQRHIATQIDMAFQAGWHHMLTTLAAENAALRAENEELDFLRHEGGPDSVAAMEIELATLRASEAAALERIAELEAVNRSALDSRTHFKISAGRQKERCHKLRHRQRALLSALETIRFATSLDDAKFKANVAIGGWSDDELIYNARALTPTADKEPKT